MLKEKVNTTPEPHAHNRGEDMRGGSMDCSGRMKSRFCQLQGLNRPLCQSKKRMRWGVEVISNFRVGGIRGSDRPPMGYLEVFLLIGVVSLWTILVRIVVHKGPCLFNVFKIFIIVDRSGFITARWRQWSRRQSRPLTSQGLGVFQIPIYRLNGIFNPILLLLIKYMSMSLLAWNSLTIESNSSRFQMCQLCLPCESARSIDEPF